MISSAHIDLPSNLAALLAAGHVTAQEPPAQSVRGGTQGNLESTNLKPVLKLKRAILERFDGMKFSGIWSTALHKDGYHVPHNHPKGEISGVVYVSVPSNLGGHFQYWEDYGALETPKTVAAMEGTMLTFPSTMIHAVTRYDDERPRLAVGFDLVKNG